MGLLQITPVAAVIVTELSRRIRDNLSTHSIYLVNMYRKRETFKCYTFTHYLQFRLL